MCPVLSEFGLEFQSYRSIHSTIGVYISEIEKQDKQTLIILLLKNCVIEGYKTNG